MKSAKLSERMTPKLCGVAVPEADRRDRGADEADEAEAGDRHPLAGLPERLGEHGGDRRQRDDDDRDDGERSRSLLATRDRGRRLAAAVGSGRRLARFERAGALRLRSRSSARPVRPRESLDAARSAKLRPVTRSMVRLTDGSIGRRKTLGNTPIRIAMAIVGTISAHSRGVRSGSARFFSFVISP